MADPTADSQSIEQMAANGTGDPQEALFALEGDKPMNVGTLIKRGMDVESEVSIMSASVPIRGLIDPDKPGKLLVSYVPAGYRLVPVRDGERVASWKVRQYLRLVWVDQFVDAEAKDSPDDQDEK